MFRSYRRIVAWLAGFAMLFGALAPTISHAMAAAQGKAPWAQVCSVYGTKFVPLDIGNTQQPQPGKPAQPMSMEHCPYCLWQTGTAALLDTTPFVLIDPMPGKALPALFYHAPYPLFAWAPSNPRGPPARS